MNTFAIANYLVDPIVKLLNAQWLSDITIWSILVRILLSVILSGLVGMERAAKRHAAGLRTYILVSLGATVAMMTNEFLMAFYGSGDSARLAAQVISGIGFLGAGTILISSRSQIKGLTTAAGLWATACIGISIGAGFYTLALIGSAVVMSALMFLPRFEYYVRDHAKYIEYHIEFSTKEAIRSFIDNCRKQGMVVQSVEFNSAFSSETVFSYSFIIEKRKGDKRNHIQILSDFSKLPFVTFIEELF